jgi:hypothetical protein
MFLPFEREFIEVRGTSIVTGDSTIHRVLRYYDMRHPQFADKTGEVEVLVQVLNFAANGPALGPQLNPDAAPYLVSIFARNDTFVSMAPGREGEILAIKPKEQPQQEFEAECAADARPGLLQGDYFLMAREGAIPFAAMMRQHMRQLDQMRPGL